MKKLILLALLIVGTTITAQEKNKKEHQKDETEQFTPEQKNQLKVKKLTLELDLNETQQKEISTLLSEKEAKREAKKAAKEQNTKPTRDERFAMAMEKLDEQIAAKKQMEKILNPKQLEKWESIIDSVKTHREKHRENQSKKEKKKE